MDAALITGMFNVGFNNIAREPAKDVFTKKDSSFDDVLSKSMEKENNKYGIGNNYAAINNGIGGTLVAQ